MDSDGYGWIWVSTDGFGSVGVLTLCRFETGWHRSYMAGNTHIGWATDLGEYYGWMVTECQWVRMLCGFETGGHGC